MNTKILEIRDRMTYIAVMATRMKSDNEVQNYYLRRAGYPPNSVIVTRLDDAESQNDPYKWPRARTMRAAHSYIAEHFEELHEGDVIDVEFILKESDKAKVSERYYG